MNKLVVVKRLNGLHCFVYPSSVLISMDINDGNDIEASLMIGFNDRYGETMLARYLVDRSYQRNKSRSLFYLLP